MPNPLRVVARILTGSTYVVLGADALLTPGKRPEIAGETLAAIRKVVPLPENDTLLVQANAAVMVGGGAMLALGRVPRLAALALAASLVPDHRGRPPVLDDRGPGGPRPAEDPLLEERRACSAACCSSRSTRRASPTPGRAPPRCR